MKKFIISLILLFGLLCLSECSPKFAYFTTNTVQPQHVVDSLLQPKKIDYKTWTGFQTIGINAGDSTVITTFVYSTGNQTVSVIEYGNTGLVSVTEKKRKK